MLGGYSLTSLIDRFVDLDQICRPAGGVEKEGDATSVRKAALG
jgi:hypothetical protein